MLCTCVVRGTHTQGAYIRPLKNIENPLNMFHRMQSAHNISANGAFIATVSEYYDIKGTLVDIYFNEKRMQTFTINSYYPIKKLEWSPNGKYLTLFDGISEAFIVERIGNKFVPIEKISGVKSIALSNNYFAVSPSHEKKSNIGVEIWSYSKLDKPIKIFFSKYSFHIMSWSPCNKYIAFYIQGNPDDDLYIYSLENNKAIKAPRIFLDIFDINWHPSSEFLCITDSRCCSIIKFSNNKISLIKRVQLPEPITSLWIPNGSVLIVSCMDEKIRFFNFSNFSDLKLIKTYDCWSTEKMSLYFGPLPYIFNKIKKGEVDFNKLPDDVKKLLKNAMF